MAVPISKVVLPPTNNIAKELDEIYKHLHELDFISIEGAGPNKTLEKKESLQKEKQISIDPISLRDSSMGEVSFNMMLQPIDAPPDDCAVTLPPPLLPAKHKFLSCSLPNSATSSPRFAARKKKNLRNETQPASPRKVEKTVHKNSFTTQHLDQDQDQVMFWRSKSCGEGRACPPPEDLDELWLHHAKALQHKNKLKLRDHGSSIPNINNDNTGKSRKKATESDEDDEDFKCSALCLFLPGFSKVPKPVRPSKVEPMAMENNVISRTVSLEKFECGSWASSTIIQDHDDDVDSMNNLYFDLPLELIKNLGSDAHLPVSAAFVFDKDIKGVLKNGSASTRAIGTGAAAGRKSHESSRHVRFSTSSPTSYPASPSCITPRLRKAREDFNAFLEAQSA